MSFNKSKSFYSFKAFLITLQGEVAAATGVTPPSRDVMVKTDVKSSAWDTARITGSDGAWLSARLREKLVTAVHDALAHTATPEHDELVLTRPRRRRAPHWAGWRRPGGLVWHRVRRGPFTATPTHVYGSSGGDARSSTGRGDHKPGRQCNRCGRWCTRGHPR